MPLPPEFSVGSNGGSNIPLVGQVCKPHVGYAMASFTCLCRPTNDPQLLRGTDIATVCPHCRKIYRILKVEFDIRKGEPMPRVTIGAVGLADEPAKGGSQ